MEFPFNNFCWHKSNITAVTNHKSHREIFNQTWNTALINDVIEIKQQL